MPWDGLKELNDWVQKQATATDNAVKEAVAKASALTIKEAGADFQGSHKAGKPHIGPNGGYPNRVTGNMARSITADPIIKYGLADYGTSVGPRAVQSRAIELGLRNAPNIKYPFFVPGAQRAAKQFSDIWSQTFAKYLK